MNQFAYCFSTEPRYGYFVLLHTAEAPEEAIWSQYVQALASKIAQSHATLHIFAVTDGGGPGAAQRQALAQAFAQDQRGSTTHVLTTSAVTRGIVTAFHWLARSRAVAHAPEEFPALCERCQIPARVVLADLWRLQEVLPPVLLLDKLQRVMNGGSLRPDPGKPRE